MILYHVWVVSHSPVFLLVFYQFKQDGQIDDVFLVQTKFFLQHISVPVDTVLREKTRSQRLHLCYSLTFVENLTDLHVDVFRL